MGRGANAYPTGASCSGIGEFLASFRVNGSRPAATTGYEKGPEGDAAARRAILVGWLDTEAETELAFTNPCVNVARTLAGHNEE